MTTWLLYAAAGLVIIGLLAGVLLGKLKETRHQYMSCKTVLSAPEQVLFHRLHEALPECVILAQVGLSRVIKPAGTGKERRALLNRISQKSLDFVVCLKDFSVVAAIELDDRSHLLEHRVNADTDKEAALANAGISLVRINVSEIPGIKELRAMFVE